MCVDSPRHVSGELSSEQTYISSLTFVVLLKCQITYARELNCTDKFISISTQRADKKVGPIRAEIRHSDTYE